MKTIILLAVLFYATFCFGQSTDEYGKRFSFGYNYGTSIARGEFGANSSSQLPMTLSKLPKGKFIKGDTDELNGYAKSGFHYDIYLTYEFIPHLSAMIAVSGDQNSYDINALSSQFDALYPPNSVLAVTGDNYYIVQYLIGPYLNPRIVGNLHFELKLLAGLTTANYPGISFILSPNLPTDNYTNYTFPKGSGFGYNIGGGINFGAVIGPIGLGVHLNADYESATITYPSYNITNYNLGSISSHSYTIPKTMSVNIIQLTVGLSVEI